MKLTGYDGLFGYGGKYHRWAIARRLRKQRQRVRRRKEMKDL
jgi:hypothetical protein